VSAGDWSAAILVVDGSSLQSLADTQPITPERLKQVRAGVRDARGKYNVVDFPIW
jgi:hypothetical protein